MEPQSNTQQQPEKQDTAGEVGISPAKVRQTVGFSDLAPHDIVGMIVATTLEAQRSGIELVISNGRRNGQGGVMVWIPNFTIENGAVVVAK